MSGLPSITVVVPSLNQAPFLEQALRSVLDQEYPSLELIVMDGGSSDGSVAIIERYADRLRHWQSGPDGGQGAAIQQGVGRGTGELVAWLNADDFYREGALRRVARAHERHPGFGLYIGNGFRYREHEGRILEQPFCRRHLALNRRALIEGIDYVLQPSTFFLRTAWDEVGGLDVGLRYCLDWDLVIRIAARRPAVLIDELLSDSREYADTKSAAGGRVRAEEIARMTERHAGKRTAGARFYLAEAALGGSEAFSDEATRPTSPEMTTLRREFRREYGNSDGFPEEGDPQDVTDLPFVSSGVPRVRGGPTPSISVVTPSFNQARFLGPALASVLDQGYPRLETLVFDGGSTDGSVDVLRALEGRLTSWVSQRDRGPADAINRGLRQATGEIVSWLNSDDLLAEDALWEVARAFAADPDLDVVYGNALYIDEDAAPAHADHGGYRTGLYYGAFQPLERVPLYWTYVHSVPQPTVFFRKRLLERTGPLDESYQFIFDFELFGRFVAHGARIRKLEKTLAFYRLHAGGKTAEWSHFLVELYRFSRPRWPRPGSGEFLRTWRSFLNHYLARRFADGRGWRFWLTALLAGLSALTRIGNPEALARYSPAAWMRRARQRRARQTT